MEECKVGRRLIRSFVRIRRRWASLFTCKAEAGIEQGRRDLSKNNQALIGAILNPALLTINDVYDDGICFEKDQRNWMGPCPNIDIAVPHLFQTTDGVYQAEAHQVNAQSTYTHTYLSRVRVSSSRWHETATSLEETTPDWISATPDVSASNRNLVDGGLVGRNTQFTEITGATWWGATINDLTTHYPGIV